MDIPKDKITKLSKNQINTIFGGAPTEIVTPKPLTTCEKSKEFVNNTDSVQPSFEEQLKKVYKELAIDENKKLEDLNNGEKIGVLLSSIDQECMDITKELFDKVKETTGKELLEGIYTKKEFEKLSDKVNNSWFILDKIKGTLNKAQCTVIEKEDINAFCCFIATRIGNEKALEFLKERGLINEYMQIKKEILEIIEPIKYIFSFIVVQKAIEHLKGDVDKAQLYLNCLDKSLIEVCKDRCEGSKYAISEEQQEKIREILLDKTIETGAAAGKLTTTADGDGVRKNIFEETKQKHPKLYLITQKEFLGNNLTFIETFKKRINGKEYEILLQGIKEEKVNILKIKNLLNKRILERAANNDINSEVSAAKTNIFCSEADGDGVRKNIFEETKQKHPKLYLITQKEFLGNNLTFLETSKKIINGKEYEILLQGIKEEKVNILKIKNLLNKRILERAANNDINSEVSAAKTNIFCSEGMFYGIGSVLTLAIGGVILYECNSFHKEKEKNNI